MINTNLKRKNEKNAHALVNKKVLKMKVHDPSKFGIQTQGPYKIKQVHTNGTLTIKIPPGITQRINVHIILFHKETIDPV